MEIQSVRVSSIVAAAFLVTSLVSHAQQGSAPGASKQQQAPQRITSVEGIDGVLSFQRPPSASLSGAVEADYQRKHHLSCRIQDESYGETGMAHSAV